jgi:molecular chaperone HscA
VAEKLGGGKPIWSSTDGGTADSWQTMVALPDAVALFTGTDTNQKRHMIILNASDGRKRWERTLDGQDSVYFIGDMAVLADQAGNRLLGLKIGDNGNTAWNLPNVKTTYGSAAKIVPVSTADDLNGPADVTGRPFAPELDDDTRLVQISEDKSARVIDAATGKVVVPSKPSIAGSSDEIIAHDGRLIVHEASNDRIVTYDLKSLGEPTGRYTAANSNDQLDQLTPCGKDRVCLIETAGSDAKTAQVVAINIAKGGHWSRTVPSAETLLPVGESVLVGQDTSPDSVSLLDGSGKILWTRDGTAGRLDAGNMLLFSKALSTGPDDPSLTGQHLGSGVKPMGALADIRTSSCAWNTGTLACVGDKDFELIKFAK